MDSQRAFAGAVLEQGHRMLVANIHGVSIDEALEAAGGFRSILGILKHVAGRVSDHAPVDSRPKTEILDHRKKR